MGEKMGSTSGASNILPPSLHYIFFFCPHLHFLLFLPPPSSFFYMISHLRLPHSPSLFSKSFKGGHGGDNANTDPLNREWEEDSCWRWQRWLLKRNLSLFPLACCRTHTHAHTRTHCGSCFFSTGATMSWRHSQLSNTSVRAHTHRHVSTHTNTYTRVWNCSHSSLYSVAVMWHACSTFMDLCAFRLHAVGNVQM